MVSFNRSLIQLKRDAPKLAVGVYIQPTRGFTDAFFEYRLSILNIFKLSHHIEILQVTIIARTFHSLSLFILKYRKSKFGFG